VTRRLIRLRRTCSTKPRVNPFSADAGFEPFFATDGVGSGFDFFLMNQMPGAFVSRGVFSNVVERFVVLPQATVNVVRLADVEFSRGFRAENVHEEHRCPRPPTHKKSRGSAQALKAPPVGFEPTTRRLTAACSTN
jgi:hypothetical protein